MTFGPTERTAFGISGDAGISVDRDDSGVKQLDKITVGPAIAALSER
jgi:hypothetical protein